MPPLKNAPKWFLFCDFLLTQTLSLTLTYFKLSNESSTPHLTYLCHSPVENLMLATRLEHSLMMDSQLMYSTDDGDDEGRGGDTNRGGVEGLFREGLEDDDDEEDEEDDDDEEEGDWGNRGSSVNVVSVMDHAKVCEERDQLALEARNLRYYQWDDANTQPSPSPPPFITSPFSLRTRLPQRNLKYQKR